MANRCIRWLVLVVVMSVAVPAGGRHLLHSAETESASHRCTWSEDVGALACAVAAVRAELAKAGPDVDALNEAAPEEGNEIDADKVQRALMQLRFGDLVLHDEKMRRVVSSADSFLVHAYEKYQSLKEQTPRRLEREWDQVEDVGNNLRDLLENRGLNRAVNAVFTVAMVVADVSNDGHSRLERTGGKVRTRPAAAISWRTRTPRHWFGVPSFSGGFGYAAIPAVWSLPRMEASDADGSDAGCADGEEMDGAESDGQCYLVQHQDGFFYDFRVNWPSLRVGGSRLSGFGGIGQARLNSPDLKYGEGDDAQVASLAENRTGMWSYRWEYGIEYRLFDADRMVVDYGRASVTPALELAIGLRYKERFKPSEDLTFLALQDADMQAPGDPRKRFFWRLGVDLRHVMFWRDEASDETPSPFSVRFVAEQELDRPGAHVPTTTRIFIQGETALKKLGFVD